MGGLFERIKSARYVMATVVTTLGSLLMLILMMWIMKRGTPETVDKVATIAVTGFFTIWSSIVTFYFTRTDRKPPTGG